MATRKLRRIFLVGPMGSGKTTIGRLLARHLQLKFIDSDQEVAARSGTDISWIFDVEGEAGFREREQRLIAELIELDNIVLATGGGVVLRPENRRLLAARGVVVYLHTDIAQQLARVGDGRRRPLLTTGDVEQTLRELMAQREPLYREIADHVVDTNGLNSRAVAEQLATVLS